jgi:hypothetical protein
MPDPGEPHRPEREEYQSDDDYLHDLERYADMMYPPHEIKIIHEARMGVREIEEYLEENHDR